MPSSTRIVIRCRSGAAGTPARGRHRLGLRPFLQGCEGGSREWMWASEGRSRPGSVPAGNRHPPSSIRCDEGLRGCQSPAAVPAGHLVHHKPTRTGASRLERERRRRNPNAPRCRRKRAPIAVVVETPTRQRAGRAAATFDYVLATWFLPLRESCPSSRANDIGRAEGPPTRCLPTKCRKGIRFCASSAEGAKSALYSGASNGADFSECDPKELRALHAGT